MAWNISYSPSVGGFNIPVAPAAGMLSLTGIAPAVSVSGGVTTVFDYSAGVPSGDQSQFTGTTDANSPLFSGTALVVLNGTVGQHEAAGSWYTAQKINAATFTTDFTITIGAESISGESVGTGNGSTKTFSHTLGNGQDARPGSLTVTAGSVVGTDDGNGNITGAGISGTLNYLSRTFTVTYTTAPANGTAITCAFDAPCYGACFIIQNDPAGPALSADANGLGYMIYTYNYPDIAIHDSVAIVFNATPNSASAISKSPSTLALLMNGGPYIDNGVFPIQDMTAQGIDLGTGNALACHAVYDGAVLSFDITDTVTGAKAHFDWPVDIPSIVGASTAYTGFGGGSISAAEVLVPGWKWQNGALTRTARPTFSPSPGSYATAQSVTISAAAGATIYYTTNGKPPTTASSVYSGPFSVSANTCIQAIAAVSGYENSLPAMGNYQVQTAGSPVINFPSGFSSASGLLCLAGRGAINGSSLIVTDGTVHSEIGAAWYVAPVSVSTFSTSFTLSFSPGTSGAHNGLAFVLANQGATPFIGIPFKLTAPASGVGATLSNAWDRNTGSYLVEFSDGQVRTASMTNGSTAVAWSVALTGSPQAWLAVTRSLDVCVSGGPYSLGNQQVTSEGQSGSVFGNGGIGNSVAVVFDVWNQSIGLSYNGQVPLTETSIAGINVGVNPLVCTLTYDGTTLSAVIKDTVTSVTFNTSWAVDVPAYVGASSAFVGFTGSSYDSNVAQSVTEWTF